MTAPREVRQSARLATNLPPIARFFFQVEREGACWIWTGARRREYGVIRVNGRQEPAHRFAHEYFKGPVPDGLVLDHLCRNPPCVNPDHLEPVTQRENVLRGVGYSALAAARTACSHGHEYTPENTSITTGGWRRCRTCVRIYRRRAYAKKAAA